MADDRSVIIWLNGPFGAGKTTVANRLLAIEPSLLLFDTESIGYLLQSALGDRKPVADFQDWFAWRRLVVSTLEALSDETRADLLVPQTVIVERYWTEILGGLQSAGHVVLPFTLDVDPQEHERRISSDTLEVSAAGWRRQRRPDYDAARPWLESTSTVLDTTQTTADQVARAILEAARQQRLASATQRH